MAQTHANLSIINATITIVHPVIPFNKDLKLFMPADSAISTTTTERAVRNRSLGGSTGKGNKYVDYTTDMQFQPDTEALTDFFQLWHDYESINGATPAAFLYVTYGARRVQHVFSGGTLMNYNPLASFQDVAQNQTVQIIWDFYNQVRI